MFPSPRCPRAGQSGLWQNWACGSNGDPPGARFGTMLGGMLGGPALFKPQPPNPRFNVIGIYTARTALLATTWNRSAVSAFGSHEGVSYPQALGNKGLGAGTASDRQVRPTPMQVGTTAARPVPPRSCGENRCVDTDGHQPWPAGPSGQHRVAANPGEGGHVAGQPLDADQQGQAPGGPADHPHDGRDQGQVAAGAEHPAQPEPRRGRHRHRHPEPPGDRLDEPLVGRDVAQRDRTAQDVVLMELLTVPARPVAPGGDGPLVKSVGGDDRLPRTAVAEQGQHDDHQFSRLLEAVVRGVVSGSEGPVTGGRAVAPLLAAVNAEVSEPALPACGAVGVVAELVLRVHRCSSRGTVW